MFENTDILKHVLVPSVVAIREQKYEVKSFIVAMVEGDALQVLSILMPMTQHDVAVAWFVGHEDGNLAESLGGVVAAGMLSGGTGCGANNQFAVLDVGGENFVGAQKVSD